MKALVTLEEHLRRDSNGCCYACGPGGYAAWRELLEAFDEVVLVVRVRKDDCHLPGEVQIDGPFVSVCELPDYTGPWECLLKLPLLRRRIRAAAAECDASFLRVPGLVAYLAWREVVRTGKRYALDVMGDPWDALGPGTVKSPLRSVYRRVATHGMKMICASADAALYWSHGALQQRYPSKKASYTAVSPQINLSHGYADAQLMSERRGRLTEWHAARGNQRRELRVGFIGSLAQLYKGPDILLRAVSLCSRARVGLRVFLVGEGRYRKAMESLARELSLENDVVFLGQLVFGKPIFDFLDSIDLFVMPSRAEGLPRALLEAMARGCPCIGANVGAIPELLGADDLFRCGDPDRLAAKILEVTATRERMTQMSVRNLEKAKEYDPQALRGIRQNFYRFVRARSGTAGQNSSMAAAKTVP